MTPNIQEPPHLIVLTGCPGSGKSSLEHSLKTHFPQAIFVREIVTDAHGRLGVLPPADDPKRMREYLLQIARKQRADEQLVIGSHNPPTLSFWDRGSLDPAPYWPDGEAAFVQDVLESTFDAEYERYRLVICMGIPSSAIYGNIKGNNPARHETYEQALALDERMRRVWNWRGDNGRFQYVGGTELWEEKVSQVISLIRGVL